MKRCALLVVAVMGFAACGDDENLADPRLIEGGGVSDGAIAGRVNVYAIDSSTDEPISGAEVRIGEPGEEPLMGTTDSSGLFTIDDGSLGGPTTVTVTADGYYPQTWFGADGVNMTIPLNPESAGDVAQARLEGTIAGWDQMDAPEMNHVVIGIVLYSQTRDLGDPGNDLPQPSGTGGLPGNACFVSALGSQCDWAVNARTGSVALFSVILDVDTKGTPQDDSDDTSEVIGFAYRLGLTVEDGVDQSGIELEMLDLAQMTDVTVETETPPTGIDNSLGVILGLDLGDDGIAQLGFLQDTEDNLVTVPSLSGPFDGMSYQAIAFAQAGDSDADPSSGIFQRGITDLSAAVTMGAWMDLPTDLAESGGEYSFTPVEGADFHVASIDDGGQEVWGIALLDGRTSFTLPGLDPDPLPSGELDFVVSAFEGDVNLTDFRIEDFASSIDRLSDNSVSVSR